MPFWERVADMFGFAAALAEGEETTGNMPSGLLPGRQQAAVTTERALSLSTFYRGIQIHATAACQLSVAVERGGAQLAEVPALVAQPDLDQSRSAFLEYTVVSLYVDGNAFWKLTRNDAGLVVNATPLDPREVTVLVDRDRFGQKTNTYGYLGNTYTSRDIRHLQLLRVPGLHRGLGPIQAAQIEVRGALDARDYGAMWLSDASMPDGVLTTKEQLAPGDGEKIKNVWYGRNPDGSEKTNSRNRGMHERLRVLDSGLTYSPILLKPSDIQFLESQQYSTVQMARLIGAPASIMLVSPEGTSQTYQNVEQEWIAYIRFGLMKALREIEEAFTSILPGKQVARFKIDALLRSDTKARYEAYAISLDPNKGWAVVDEVRSREGMPPLTPEQRAELDARRTTTPTEETTNA